MSNRKWATFIFGLTLFLSLSEVVFSGNVWVPTLIPYGNTYRDVDNVGAKTIWVTTGYQIFKSTDGGIVWNEPVDFNTSNVRVIDFWDQQTGYGVGQVGTIEKTIDGGSSWSLLSSGTTNSLTDITIVSSEVVWVVGYDGTVLKTTNGGSSWMAQTVPVSYDILAISAIDENRAWLTGSPQHLFMYTENGGETWIEADGATIPYYSGVDIHFVNDSTGWVITAGDIYKTIDKGQTWTKQFSRPVAGTFNEMVFTDENTGWVVGETSSIGMIYRTIDGGETWTGQWTDGYYVSKHYAACAFDSATAWLTGNTRVFAYTAEPSITITYPNGSETLGIGSKAILRWQNVTTPFVDIFYSNDNGSNWTLIADTVAAVNGFFYWDVPNVESDECLVKIVGSHDYFDQFSNQSDAVFSMAEKPIQFDRLNFFSNVLANDQNSTNSFNRGQPICFKVDVSSHLSQNLLTASGIVRTNCPYLSITDNVAAFNNILVNQSASPADEFEFIISADAPDEFVAEFEIEISDQIVIGGPWTDSFIVPIVLNPFEVSLVIIDDDNNPDSHGDNDDIAEPGEIIEILPLINSISLNRYNLIYGELLTVAGYIDIWNNHAGASGIVMSRYPYNFIAGSSQTVEAFQTNIMPEQDFVFIHNGAEPYSLPFQILVSASVEKYDNMQMKWLVDFEINQGLPEDLNITITFPLNGSQVEQGQEVLITADAAGIHGIQKVLFYCNDTELGSVLAEPYSLNYSTVDLNPGDYEIVAEAWDLLNNTVRDTVTITILPVSALNEPDMPLKFSMQSYPNPFNATTTFQYSLPDDGHVCLSIYTITGGLVTTLVNERRPAGRYQQRWDARDLKGNALATGIYYYQIKTENEQKTGKLLLLK